MDEVLVHSSPELGGELAWEHIGIAPAEKYFESPVEQGEDSGSEIVNFLDFVEHEERSALGKKFVVVFQDSIEIDRSLQGFGKIYEYDILEGNKIFFDQIPERLEHGISFPSAPGSDERHDFVEFHEIEIEREIPSENGNILESLLIVENEPFVHEGKLYQIIHLIVGK